MTEQNIQIQNKAAQNSEKKNAVITDLKKEDGNIMPKTTYIETHTSQETFAVGQELGRRAAAGQVYTLTGDLGVGKTVLTQGIAAGLGITEPVNSPTFTIVQIYEDGRLPLYHFDAYRIADIVEMDEIGYEDYFFGEGICIIEWAEQIRELIPAAAIPITIEKNLEKGFDYRKITITQQ